MVTACGVYGKSVLSSQFFSKSEIVLKSKVYFKKILSIPSIFLNSEIMYFMTFKIFLLIF